MPRRTDEDIEKTIYIGEYKLSKDSFQWIVEYFKKGRERKIKNEESLVKTADRWILVGYYPKLEHALEKLLEYKLLISDAEDIRTLIWTLNNAKAEIVDAVKKMNRR